LTEVAIDGFTSMGEKTSLKLGPLTMLIGANGAGKSNFMLFFRMLNYMMSGSLQSFIGTFGGAGSLLHLGAKRTQTCGGRVVFETNDGINSYEFRLAHARPDRLIFTDEALDFQGHAKKLRREPLVLDAGHTETALLRPENREKKICKVFHQCLSGFRFFQFHDTSDASALRGYTDVAENNYLRADGRNLAAILLRLQQQFPQEYVRIVHTLKLVAPFFEDFILTPQVSRDSSSNAVAEQGAARGCPLLLRWRGKEPDYEYGVHQLSDGTLRFIALTTLLLLPAALRPKASFIDEPELGLHPKALSVLAGMLRSASAEMQILCSTQSPTLLDHFAADEVVVVEREDGNSTLRRLREQDLATWKDDYSLGEMWTMNLVGGRPARE